MVCLRNLGLGGDAGEGGEDFAELGDKAGGVVGGDGGGDEQRGGAKKGEPSKEAVSGVCTEEPSVSVLALSLSASPSVSSSDDSSSSSKGGGSSTKAGLGTASLPATDSVPRVAPVSDVAFAGLIAFPAGLP